MEGAIKTSALCAASALFMAPLPEFEEVRKSKRVGERSVFPFVCMWANSCMWVVYGLYIGNIFPTVMTNCVGLMFATYYCGVFAYALENPSRKAEAYNMFATTILIICALCMLCFGGIMTNSVSGLEDGKGGVVDDQVQKWVGLVAASSTVIQYASPLTALVKVVRRRSTEGLSGRLAVVSLVCGMLWLLYGIVTNDPFLYVPNTLGVAAAFAQCLLFLLFPGRSDDDASNSPSKLKRKDSKPWRASPVRISALSPTRPPRSSGSGARSPKGRSRTSTTAPARDLASVA